MTTPAETIRVLVTGSRWYPSPGRVAEAFDDAEKAFPGAVLLLVHGKCDPRHPVTRRRVRWAAAATWPAARKQDLLGGDWLADLEATRRGWPVETHAADWSQGDSAGFDRNDFMISLGARLVLAFTELCAKPGHARMEPHITHGTAHCAGRAEEEGIDVWPYAA